VLDPDAGIGDSGQLFRVDAVTGARTVVSDFYSGLPRGVNPTGIAIESTGNILALDPDAGTGDSGQLFRVNAVTGARTVVSDFYSGLPRGVNPTGIAIESTGNILVLDPDAGTGSRGQLFRVNAVTGARTVFADFSSGEPVGTNPTGIAIESTGSILVVDPDAGTGNSGQLFRVNAVTGARTVVSDFYSGLPRGVNPTGIAIESTGSILVVDPDAGTGNSGQLFRVNAVTGARTVVSDFYSELPRGVNPTGLAIRLIPEEVFADGFEGG
jgi:acetylglutamate kinase